MNARSILRPTTSVETYFSTLVFWNPLIAATFTFVLTGRHKFVPFWLVATTISDVVGTICFGTIFAWDRAERAWLRTRCKEPRKRGHAFYFAVALLVLPLALPVGFRAGDWVGDRVGIEIQPAGEGSYRMGMGFGLAMAALFFFHRSRTQAREEKRAAEARVRELENRNLEAQIGALRAEMNPHLLFNALNTVASLVHEQPDRAEEVLVRIAELYRGVLRASGSSKHPLEDELRTCEAYLAVEKARFGERLTSTLTVADDVDLARTRIPVLLVQPFVENAVKHGLSGVARPGRVDVTVRTVQHRLVVEVIDDGVGVGHSKVKGTGRAVANCRERLALTYGEAASLTLEGGPGGGTRVTIALPLELEPASREEPS